MAQGRRRPTRLLLVALLALLVWLLLRLNQFLPGSWPGGGEDMGSRSVPKSPVTDPARVRPPDPSPPPEGRRESSSVHVVVRRPDGSPTEASAIGVERESAPGTEEVLVPQGAGGADIAAEGGLRVFRVALGSEGPSVEHGSPPSGSPRQWIVQWPMAPFPKAWSPPGGAAPGSGAPFRVVVLDAAGAPVPGASLDVRAGTREIRAVTGPDGAASLDRALGVFRACAAAPGHGTACAYGTTFADGPLEIRLSSVLSLSTRFVDAATGAPLAARTLRLVGADGTVKTLEREGQDFREFGATMPADVAERTTLEAEVAGRPLLRVPLGAVAAETAIPAGRSLTVVVRDPAGAPVPRARVEARYAGSAGDHPKEPQEADFSTASFETDAAGTATIPLPAGRSADLRVEAEGFAPAGLRSEAGDTGSKDVALARGVAVPVVVRDAAGAPVQGADLVVVVRAGEAPARRTGRTGAAGTATVEGVPAGRIEIYAHRAGLAWASVSVDAREGMATAALVTPPGRRLLLVVEDPSGVPLSGVSVRSAARADATGVPDPVDPDGAPWTTDEHGVLSVSDLPEREIVLYLSKPGFSAEVVPRVLPGSTTWFLTLVRSR